MYHHVGDPPMDASSILDFRSGVLLVIQEFAKASEVFERWRKGSAGKKAVGQDECETSLYEGRITVEKRLNLFVRQDGSRFNTGDETSLKSIINIRKAFHEAVANALTSTVVERTAQNGKLEPIVLRVASEAAKRDTLVAMDELSNRILAEGGGHFRRTEPGDRLPPMPLRPVQSPILPGAHPNFSSASFPNLTRPDLDRPIQKNRSAISSQTSLRVPISPALQSNNINSPAAGWRFPNSTGTGESSTALVRSSSTRSGLSRWFPSTPENVRPYHDITPLEPTPPVTSSLQCGDDSWDVLREGEASVRRSWAAAHNTLDQGRPKSCPQPLQLLQGQFSDIWDDGPAPTEGILSLNERQATPPTPEDASSWLSVSPPQAQEWPSLVPGEKRIRSEPILQFSRPTPRVRRNVSGS